MDERKKKISIEGVKKRFQSHDGKEVIALNGVNLSIYENEFVCVVGPSGCGKTTLLNIIAGLEHASEGKVLINGNPIVGPGNDRGVVFQQYALFPWLTVKKNVEFGLAYKYIKEADPSTGEARYRKLTKEEKAEKAEKAEGAKEDAASEDEDLPAEKAEKTPKKSPKTPKKDDKDNKDEKAKKGRKGRKENKNVGGGGLMDLGPVKKHTKKKAPAKK